MILEYREDMTIEQHAAWHEIQDIEQWFKDNDYIINKMVLGEWPTTDPRFIEYVNNRALKRARLDVLLALFN